MQGLQGMVLAGGPESNSIAIVREVKILYFANILQYDHDLTAKNCYKLAQNSKRWNKLLNKF